MTIDEIRTANTVRGYYFFQPAAMRFFRSRVCSEVHSGPLLHYFVTSEEFMFRGMGAGRRYSVHHFDPRTGQVGNASEFQAFATRKQALGHARNCARAEHAAHQATAEAP